MPTLHNYTGTCARMWCDTARSEFVDSLVELMIYSNEHLGRWYYDKATYSWHSGARNELVEKFKGEWLLQLDTDHSFAPDLLARLLHYATAAKTRVISAIYQYKFPPYAPVAGVWDENGKVISLAKWNPADKVLPMGVVGGGALLIHRSVFNELKKKYACGPFDIMGGYSEDFSFCRRCHDSNIPIHLATAVQAHHLVVHRLHIEDYIMPEATESALILDDGSITPYDAKLDVR